MTNIKKFLLFIIAFLLFDCVFIKVFSYDSFDDIKHKGHLNVYTSADYYPLAYREGNEILGIEVDIAKKIAANLGLDLKISDVSFDALLLELSNGKCDFVISSMASTLEREKSVDFSTPYLKSYQQIIVRKDSDIKTPNDLHSKKIGAQSSSTLYSYCTENFKDSTIVPYAKPTEAMLDLINGQIDTVVLNDLPAEKLIAKYKNKVKILEESLGFEEYVAAVAKGNSGLLSALNKEIENLKINNEIQKILDNYKSGSTSDQSEFFNNLIYKERYKTILNGLSITFEISIFSLIIGISIGLLLCYIKIYPNKSILFIVLKKIVDGYVSVIRGTPLLVQLFFVYYLILSPMGANAILASVLVFGLNSGAYVTEIMRAGFSAIDTGQSEAGLSLGMSYNLVIKKVLLPQALKNIIPPLCNEFISLVKETSVVGFIGVIDLTKASEIIRNQTYQPFVPIVTTAILYFCISSIIVTLMRKLERNLSYGNKS